MGFAQVPLYPSTSRTVPQNCWSWRRGTFTYTSSHGLSKRGVGPCPFSSDQRMARPLAPKEAQQLCKPRYWSPSCTKAHCPEQAVVTALLCGLILKTNQGTCLKLASLVTSDREV